jgi:hypothetical protein
LTSIALPKTMMVATMLMALPMLVTGLLSRRAMLRKWEVGNEGETLASQSIKEVSEGDNIECIAPFGLPLCFFNIS